MTPVFRVLVVEQDPERARALRSVFPLEFFSVAVVEPGPVEEVLAKHLRASASAVLTFAPDVLRMSPTALRLALSGSNANW